ncbi:DUF4129 domain-containing protein [Streptomyces sp. NPDC005892]|uniref:DUF4129 domain-containing protein n=1 Tax=Streptomyces sp. NPDC005892 TaxID=3155593 RepID=UPI0033ED735B
MRGRTTAGRRRRSAIGAAQTALTVLMVGGLVLGTLLLHPDTGLWTKGRGPLGGNSVLVVGLALLSLAGGFTLREKYRDQVDAAARELDPVGQRLVDGVRHVLLAASLAVPLLVLVLHRFGSPGSSQGGGHGPAQRPAPQQDPVPALPTAQPAGHGGHSTHFGPVRVLLGLGMVLLLVVVVFAGLRLWRRLTRLPPAPEAPATYATLDDEQDRLARAVNSGRRALLDGTDARAAVIACYAAMVESLADSGVTRRASDSPQDLLERAVADGLPTEAAASALTGLFREARYSTHPMDGSHRDRAAAALAEIAEGLRSRPSGPEAVTGAS